MLLFEIEKMKTLLGRSSVRMRTPDLLRVWLPRCYPWTILLPRLKWTDRMAVLRSADEYMDDKSHRRCGGISSSPRRKMINRPAKLTRFRCVVRGMGRSGVVANPLGYVMLFTPISRPACTTLASVSCYTTPKYMLPLLAYRPHHHLLTVWRSFLVALSYARARRRSPSVCPSACLSQTGTT